METLAFATGLNSYGRNALTGSQALTYREGADSIPYRLFQPSNFNALGAEFPIILFLHGAGERGTNNTSQVTSHVQGLIDRTETGSSAAYLIAPQVPANLFWSGTPLRLALNLVEQFAATHNVDASRIYITGLSMGGFGTYSALESRPGLFAAAAPMSGGGVTTRVSSYINTPLWAFHGAADTTVPVSSSRNTISAIENAGGTRERYTELAGQGHAIWGPIYNGATYSYDLNYDANYSGTYATDGSTNIYSWLFAQQIPEPSVTLLLVTAAALFGAGRRRKLDAHIT